MPEFKHTHRMRVAADEVFEFVSDIRNMPRYMPTTQHAESDGPGRVRVEGRIKGRRYASDGFLRRIDDRNRVEWGSDEGDYFGYIEARERNGSSDVTVHLHFGDEAWRARGNEGPRREEVRRGMESALRAIEQCLSRVQTPSQLATTPNRANLERL